MTWRLAAVAAVLGLACATSAAAEVYTWTFRGVVGTGEDETGVFGAPGTNPAGLRWSAVVTTNTDTPDAESAFTDSYSYIVSSLASPVRVDFTLGDVTYVFGVGNGELFGSVYGAQGQQEGPLEVYGFKGDEYFTIQARNTRSAYANYVSYYRDDRIELGGIGLGQDFLPGPDFRSLPSLAPDDGGVLFGYVALNSYTYDHQLDVTHDYVSGWASLRVLSITAGAVPEPGAWALMLLGFGVAGVGLRRRYRFGRYATSTLPGI